MLFGQGTHRFEVARKRRDDARVAHHRLHDYAGDLSAVLCKALLEGMNVVPADDDIVVWRAVESQRSGNCRSVTLGRQVFERSVIAIKDGVAPAVVMPLELD